MKLKSLELIGFKSFVDRAQLNFPEGITAIVGPNGCGKSNIVDSILWAIGERSAKHLRGKSMEDVIFGGTEGRKPLGMAEVNLTFSNHDGMPLGQDDPYSEITITRRLFRSGESEYLINRVPCRLRDITDLFLDSGLGVDGYSIVEQGRVEYLIKANPQDRRFLIEEAAGIAKYKERKRLALMKMEATQQNVLRIQDIIAEVKRQIASLERQVKRAEEYKAVRKEMKEIELRFALKDYADLSEKSEASRGYLKALRDREAEISTQTAQGEASIEAVRIQTMEEEEQLGSLQREFLDLGRNIQRMESELEFIRREEENLRGQESHLLEEVRESFRAWREAHRERRRMMLSREGLEQEQGLAAEALKNLEALYQEGRGTYHSMLIQTEDEKEKLIDTLTQLTGLRNRRVHLDERRGDVLKRIRSIQEEDEAANRDLAQLETTISAGMKEKETILSARAALQEEKERWEREIETSKEALSRTQAERTAREDVLRQIRSRYLSLKELQENFEGYDRGVRSILLQKKEDQEKWRGILGTVADVLEPEPRYEVALEAVLGHRLQYLIVGDRQESLQAISLLKHQGLGRGSFVPSAPVNALAEGQRNGNEEKTSEPAPLLRFVRVKEELAPLAEFLIGDIGVVDGWPEALRWMESGNGYGALVTLEGDVLERSGVISGGSRDQGLSLLERRREIRELVGRIQEEEERHRAITEKEALLERERGERESQLEEGKREIQSKELDLVYRERDLEHLGRERDQLHQKMDVLRCEKEQLEEEGQEINREREEVRVNLESLERGKEEGEGRVRTLRQQAEALGEETERVGREITQKKVVLASLEEKRNGLESHILNLSGVQRTLREQIHRRIQGIREARAHEAALGEQTSQVKQDLEASLVDHHQREETIRLQREKVEALSSSLKEVEASSKYLRQELDEVREKLHGEEIQVAEVQVRLQHLQEAMRERYGTTVSTSFGASSEELPREEMSKRLDELKAALEGFGEVNLMAVEEYQELKQRHDFLTEQQTDLQQALDSLKKAIARINRTTTKRFLETFHLVNERFKEVFARLFKGGRASLVMVDEQDPSSTGVDIVAQPPGKKLQNIDLLSGGEKALVAIALIFGLFMIKPTPFCVLDEVDAPLDDANINRFIELVGEFSKTSQFIFITHNKKTMEMAGTLYGITMESAGVSKLVSVRLN